MLKPTVIGLTSVTLVAFINGAILLLGKGTASITGVVMDAHGPVNGATVRVQATDNVTKTLADGSFSLSGLTPGREVIVTAWAPGYYVGWTKAVPSGDPVTITLRPYYTTDNPDYNWFSFEGLEGSRSCGECMPAHYQEWLADAHSQSALNPRFLSMYLGTDIYGNQSPLTRYTFHKDYGRIPLRPDPNQPYYGPGYKLDFPDTAGNCAACHVPAMAAKPGMAYAADPTQAREIELEGIFCEFCHKIGDVLLDPSTGLPYPNMPGVLSMRLYRPEGDQQLFFGTFDDVTRRVSYLPLLEESAFCAPCHFGVFWDVVIYNSFGEWLESPWSDPETGKTCQQCHMPVTDATWFVLPEKGGLERPPGRIFNHQMPGAMSEELLQNAVTMTVEALREEREIKVTVRITNDKTGHFVPTDSPLRHLILLVIVTDEEGRKLQQTSGPVVPDWGGVGDPEQGYYAGLPGKAFAKVLEELWTEISPTGAYWNPTRIVSDNRIAPFATDVSEYRFLGPAVGKVNVNVKLIFRRAFKELMDQKAWDVPDILMEREIIELAVD
ncbi:MAG: carboxypeptidase-like regulatory domain-containing protein [Candidatus Hadarchaeum sp.]